MKFKERFKQFPKEYMYDMYERIAFEAKEYSKITKNKIMDEIVKQYNEENFLYNFCTNKELDLLSLLCENKVDKINYKKSKWEINTLVNKGIVIKNNILNSDYEIEITEDLLDCVKRNVELYKERKSKRVNDDIWALTCGMLKTVCKMPYEMFKDAVKAITKIDDEDLNKIFDSPIFNYYVTGYVEENRKTKDNNYCLVYSDYYNDLEKLDEISSMHMPTSSLELNPESFINVFYYGYAINIPEVKEMYDLIEKKYSIVDFLFEIANLEGEYQITKRFPELINENKFTKKDIEIIENGLFNSLSPAYFGRSPKQVMIDEQEQEDLQLEFKHVKQDYARLNSSVRNDFFRLINSLEKFVNDKYHINNDLNNIYNKKAYDQALWEVMNYIWDNLNVFDEYIIVNPDNFSKSDLDDLYELKNNHKKGELFIVVGFEKDYTLLLCEDKLYKVKGLSKNMDQMFIGGDLPIFIKTTLIMFRGNLTYDGTLAEIGNGFVFDNDVQKNIVRDMKNAKLCDDLSK